MISSAYLPVVYAYLPASCPSPTPVPNLKNKSGLCISGVQIYRINNVATDSSQWLSPIQKPKLKSGLQKHMERTEGRLKEKR